MCGKKSRNENDTFEFSDIFHEILVDFHPKSLTLKFTMHAFQTIMLILMALVLLDATLHNLSVFSLRWHMPLIAQSAVKFYEAKRSQPFTVTVYF